MERFIFVSNEFSFEKQSDPVSVMDAGFCNILNEKTVDKSSNVLYTDCISTVSTVNTLF